MAALALSACTDPAAPSDRTITLDEPAPAPAQPPAPDAAPAPETDDELEVCDDGDRRELVTAVDGQLDAIADRDWDGALAFSTPDFRAGIDADAFASIITDAFPVVAAVEARDIGRCTLASSGDEASMVVTVEDGDGTRQPLLYLFRRDADGWGIDGALPGDGADSGEPSLTV